MLGDQGLARFRARWAQNIATTTCTIVNIVEAPLTHGERTRHPETIAHDVPCRVQPASSPRDSGEGGRATEIAEWEILLPHDQEVRIGWRIEVAGPVAEGQVYEVVGSDAGSADLIFITALCTKRKM